MNKSVPPKDQDLMIQMMVLYNYISTHLDSDTATYKQALETLFTTPQSPINKQMLRDALKQKPSYGTKKSYTLKEVMDAIDGDMNDLAYPPKPKPNTKVKNTFIPEQYQTAVAVIDAKRLARQENNRTIMEWANINWQYYKLIHFIVKSETYADFKDILFSTSAPYVIKGKNWEKIVNKLNNQLYIQLSLRYENYATKGSTQDVIKVYAETLKKKYLKWLLDQHYDFKANEALLIQKKSYTRPFRIFGLTVCTTAGIITALVLFPPTAVYVTPLIVKALRALYIITTDEILNLTQVWGYGIVTVFTLDIALIAFSLLAVAIGCYAYNTHEKKYKIPRLEAELTAYNEAAQRSMSSKTPLLMKPRALTVLTSSHSEAPLTTAYTSAIEQTKTGTIKRGNSGRVTILEDLPRSPVLGDAALTGKALVNKY